MFCVVKYETHGVVRNTKHYFVILSILTFMSCFQYRMGADILVYMGEFELYEKNLSIEYLFSFLSRRPLWVMLNVLCKYFNNDFLTLKIVHAIFVNLVIGIFLFKKTSYKYTALLFYFMTVYLPFNYNILRSSTAIAFFLLSFPYLEKKQYLMFIFFNICAIGFHEAALLVVIIALCGKLIKEQNFYKYKSVLIFLGILVPLVPNFFVNMMEPLSLLFGNNLLGARSSAYFHKEGYEGFSLTLFGYLEWLLKFAFYIWMFFKIKNLSNELNNIIKFSLFFILLMIFNNILPIFYRIADFFCVFFIVGLVELIKYYNYKGILRLYIVICVFFIFDLFMFIGYKPIYQYYPYTSIFSKELVPEREKLYGGRERVLFIR